MKNKPESRFCSVMRIIGAVLLIIALAALVTGCYLFHRHIEWGNDIIIRSNTSRSVVVIDDIDVAFLSIVGPANQGNSVTLVGGRDSLMKHLPYPKEYNIWIAHGGRVKIDVIVDWSGKPIRHKVLENLTLLPVYDTCFAGVRNLRFAFRSKSNVDSTTLRLAVDYSARYFWLSWAAPPPISHLPADTGTVGMYFISPLDSTSRGSDEYFEIEGCQLSEYFKYPPSCLRDRVGDTVIVEVRTDWRGIVRDATIVSSRTGLFNESVDRGIRDLEVRQNLVSDDLFLPVVRIAVEFHTP